MKLVKVLLLIVLSGGLSFCALAEGSKKEHNVTADGDMSNQNSQQPFCAECQLQQATGQTPNVLSEQKTKTPDGLNSATKQE